MDSTISRPPSNPFAIAPYAASEANSRGRRYPEAEAPYRGVFQRDRDRIVHSGAFRRLEYKTQVFVNHEGDMFRTRLTHSLEVAQVARSVARALRLNEDLTEAIALAHDLGHTPFGHAGQFALNECMAPYGGFEHNRQSLRVVDLLEERYPEFPGLNLTFETREGILKHCARRHIPELGAVAERFRHGGQPSLEAQVANLADEVAYNSHDLDDGLRSELVAIDDLQELESFAAPYAQVRRRWAELPPRRVIHEVVRRMIDAQVTNLIETSRERIDDASPRDIDEVRAASHPLIAFDDTFRARHLRMKRFLRKHLYRHERVQTMTEQAERVMRSLFEALYGDLSLLPANTKNRIRELERVEGNSGRARGIADYIAGMTDRFALSEHARLCPPSTT